ncbi:MAG TPA: WYL domain-containing protein [Fibrobacteria bacterium]|nr:WYL domain-containing protein [Fibrobacteria bacterium]
MSPEAFSPKSPKPGPAPVKRAAPAASKPPAASKSIPPAAKGSIAAMQIRMARGSGGPARGEDAAADSRLPPLNNKTAKVHRLVHLLEDHSEGLSIRHISAMLGVDERTVKRYLSDLRRLKFELVQVRQGSGRKSLYRIRATGSPPGHFLPALKKIRAELHAGGNPKYTALINQLMRFLEDRESAQRGESGEETPANAEAYYIDHGPFAEADPSPGILKILEGSITARTAVKLSYAGYTSEAGEFPFFPYSLCLRVGTLYLIGRQGVNQGPFKSLSVKRIKRCIATRDAFTRDAFDPAEYYKYTFGQWARQLDESPETVLLSLRAPWLERYLSESHFHPPGKILKKGKEVQFEVKMVIKTDFVNWVLSLAPDMVPVKPESLRVAVAKRLKAAVEALEKED